MNLDKGINIFWLFLGLLIMEESYRLNLGALQRPDSGLFPFLIGMVIAILSTILLIQAFKGEPRKERKQEDISYRNILLTLTSLYTYALVFEWLGFIPSTFILVFFLLKVIERKGWAVTVLVALLASLCSYVLFDLWLQATLPRGIWGI